MSKKKSPGGAACRPGGGNRKATTRTIKVYHGPRGLVKGRR